MDFKAIAEKTTERMGAKGLDQAVIDDFLHRLKMVHEGYNGKIPWSTIGDLAETDSLKLEDLGGQETIPENISNLVIIKLNGGLGTSMGLTKAKSLMPVKAGQSFLEIIRDQTQLMRKKYGAPIPLLFMNSFNTREDTLAVSGINDINKAAGDLAADFVQNMVPRVDADSLLPMSDGADADHWCPPGHGDIFLSLKITGLLDRLLAGGFKTAFLSNGDNLGAVFDNRILNYFTAEKLDFLSEVTPKTRADLKGGVLYRLNKNGDAGPIELLETAQVEEERLKDFQDINRFAYFNINNLWVNLEALKKRLDQGEFNLSLIRNPKEVQGQKVLQLETAMGSAIGRFEKTRVLIVPRTRFAPVKSCADLLVRRSDAYTLLDDYSLVKNPARSMGEPEIILDGAYKKIDDFDALFPEIPSLLNLEKLEIQGPVRFDKPIKLEGKIKLLNKGTEPVNISSLNLDTIKDQEIEL